MRYRRTFVAGVTASLLLVGCSDAEEKRAEKLRACEAIADEIRRATAGRALPDEGVCNSVKFPDTKDACERLAACNRELAEM